MKTILCSDMDSTHDPRFSCCPDPWNKLARRGLSRLFKAREAVHHHRRNRRPPRWRQIAEGWVNWDALGLMQQLGLVPDLAKTKAAAR
jgi:hypothetical protein